MIDRLFGWIGAAAITVLGLRFLWSADSMSFFAGLLFLLLAVGVVVSVEAEHA